MTTSIGVCCDEYYTILGVDVTATDADIARAYKKLALKHHPDKNLDNQNQAEENFKKIAKAYEVLHDRLKREEYDLLRRANPHCAQESGTMSREGAFAVFRMFFSFYGLPVDLCCGVCSQLLPAHARIAFCMREALPSGGLLFKQPQVMKDQVVQAKGVGVHHTYAQFSFQPNGRVVGKFLDAVTFCNTHIKGDYPEGHRSCWQGQYLLFRGCGLYLFDCTDVALEDVDFSDTDFDDGMLLSLGERLGLILPLPTSCPQREKPYPQLSRWLVGDGDEMERLQVAKSVTAVFDGCPSAFQRSDGCLRRRSLKILNQWETCTPPLLTIFATRYEDVLSVTCVNMSGEITSTIDITASSTRVFELRAALRKEMLSSAAPPVLLLPDGMLLTAAMDMVIVSKLFTIPESLALDVSSRDCCDSTPESLASEEIETCPLCDGNGALLDNICPLCDGLGGFEDMPYCAASSSALTMPLDGSG